MKKKRLLPRKSGPSDGGRKRKNEDEEILSDDPDVEGVPGLGSDEGYPPSPEDNETAEEKRLRLAKKYLEEIEREGNYCLEPSWQNENTMYCELAWALSEIWYRARAINNAIIFSPKCNGVMALRHY